MQQEDRWVLAVDFLFDAEESLRFWTEQSERNWLVSLLAVGVPREQRDFVGHWHAASSSDEHIWVYAFLMGPPSKRKRDVGHPRSRPRSRPLKHTRSIPSKKLGFWHQLAPEILLSGLVTQL